MTSAEIIEVIFSNGENKTLGNNRQLTRKGFGVRYGWCKISLSRGISAVANANAILALLRSRAEGDDDAFFSIALQIAAAEARQGRRTTAEELRAEVEKARAFITRRIGTDPIRLSARQP